VQSEPLHNDSQLSQNNVRSRLLTCPLNELHPHPSYERYGFTVPASRLSALATRGDLAFCEPLVITRQRTIIDGYPLWELARQRSRANLLCLEYDLTDTEALRWLLQRHGRSDGLNAFCRIVLALELKPWFKEQALSNQKAGGRNKGSSNLPEAERVDVRSEIALAAGASEGSVTKVKKLTTTADLDPDLLVALRNGEVSIHRAWLLSKEQRDKRRDAWWEYRSKKGLSKVIRSLLSAHQSKWPADAPSLADLVGSLSTLSSDQLCSVKVILLKAPGLVLAVSEGLLQTLRVQEALPIKCVTNSH